MELSKPICHSSQSVIVTTGILCSHLQSLYFRPQSIPHLKYLFCPFTAQGVCYLVSLKLLDQYNSNRTVRQYNSTTVHPAACIVRYLSSSICTLFVITVPEVSRSWFETLLAFLSSFLFVIIISALVAFTPPCDSKPHIESFTAGFSQLEVEITKQEMAAILEMLNRWWLHWITSLMTRMVRLADLIGKWRQFSCFTCDPP